MDAVFWVVTGFFSLVTIMGIGIECLTRLGKSRSKRFAAFLAVIREANEVVAVCRCEVAVAKTGSGQFFSVTTPPIKLTYIWPGRAVVDLNPALMEVVFTRPGSQLSYDIKWRNLHEFARELNHYLCSLDTNGAAVRGGVGGGTAS